MEIYYLLLFAPIAVTLNLYMEDQNQDILELFFLADNYQILVPR